MSKALNCAQTRTHKRIRTKPELLAQWLTSGRKAGRMTISWSACLARSCPATSSKLTGDPLKRKGTSQPAVGRWGSGHPQESHAGPHLSTISFRMRLASLLSTFLKFFRSLFRGGVVAGVMGLQFCRLPALAATYTHTRKQKHQRSVV